MRLLRAISITQNPIAQRTGQKLVPHWALSTYLPNYHVKTVTAIKNDVSVGVGCCDYLASVKNDNDISDNGNEKQPASSTETAHTYLYSQ